jgi:hypothetical protein
MRYACWITKATDTHSEYVILIAFFFNCNSGCKNAPQCCVIRSLPVLFSYGNFFFSLRPFDVRKTVLGTQLVRKTRLWRTCDRMGDSGVWPANIRTIQLCMFSSFFLVTFRFITLFLTIQVSWDVTPYCLVGSIRGFAAL